MYITSKIGIFLVWETGERKYRSQSQHPSSSNLTAFLYILELYSLNNNSIEKPDRQDYLLQIVVIVL